jgi:hypothetical protein
LRTAPYPNIHTGAELLTSETKNSQSKLTLPHSRDTPNNYSQTVTLKPHDTLVIFYSQTVV